MKKIIVFPVLMLCFQAIAQQDIASKYAALITGDSLQKQLDIIASGEFEGRETGTVGQRKAALYIEGQFSELNLKKPAGAGSYQQFYPLYYDSVLQVSLTVNEQPAENGKDYLIPIQANESVKFSSSYLVFAGYGIDDPAYNDYANINVKGKVVVFFSGEPKKDGKYFLDPSGRPSSWTTPGLAKKLEIASAQGAVGALVVNPAQEGFSQRMVANNIKSALYYPQPENSSQKKSHYALISQAYAKNIFPVPFDDALATAKSGGSFNPRPTDSKIPVAFTFSKLRTVSNASNVIGVIEGTDRKDEYVFLTAHYDHLGMHDGKIWYGADDDGSGTCGVIEMAAAFTKAAAEGHRPRRSIVFMTVSGEEEGLWGSKFYTDHPLFPLSQTSVDLNTDMVGRVDTERKTGDTLNYLYVIGHDKLSSDLAPINEEENRDHTGLTLDYKFDDPKDPYRIYYRSDHYNFARNGVPVLFFYDGMLKADYHKPTDTVEKINWDLYAKRVRMIFYTAWDMANRDDMLKRDKPLPEE